MNPTNRVLFVDDESRVLDGLRRMLYPHRNAWHMAFANSGAEALELLARERFDVIVSDVRMPGMSGVELLNIVQQRYPHMTRLVLSGQADRDELLAGIAPIHQFVQKPCSPEALRSTIERTFQLHRLVCSEPMRAAAARINSLPVLPDSYHRLVVSLDNPEADIDRIADIIMHDLSMTAKVLQLVNSAFFGAPRRIATIREAVGMLGINLIRSLALSAKLFETLAVATKAPGIADAQRALDRGLAAGKCAKTVAARLGATPFQSDQAHLAGSLSLVGTLIVAPASLCDDSADGHDAAGDYAQVGAYLLGLWGFDDEIVEAVAFHRQPSASQVERALILAAVHLAHCQTESLNESVRPDAAFLARFGIELKSNAWSRADGLAAGEPHHEPYSVC